MLDEAVTKLRALPPQEQNRIPQWILEELPDKEPWAARFVEMQAALSKFAVEARREFEARGATEPHRLQHCAVDSMTASRT